MEVDGRRANELDIRQREVVKIAGKLSRAAHDFTTSPADLSP
jgi:hypothetical protein